MIRCIVYNVITFYNLSFLFDDVSTSHISTHLRAGVGYLVLPMPVSYYVKSVFLYEYYSVGTNGGHSMK